MPFILFLCCSLEVLFFAIVFGLEFTPNTAKIIRTAIFDYLEEDSRKTDYITAVPMHVTIQRKIVAQRSLLKVDRGIEITEFEYQGQEWLLIVSVTPSNKKF
jgi:hypothetical protein